MAPTLRPRLLDLFSGAGGAAMGYYQSGFDVVGIDISPQPRYPFEFIQTDIMSEIDLVTLATGFDAIHASPPCQRYSTMTKKWGRSDDHPDLIPSIREMLQHISLPYVIENVPGAPLISPLLLCGSMFNLRVRRHRHFEIGNVRESIVQPPCDHKSQGRVVGVYGNPGGSSTRDGITFATTSGWREAMKIDWMTAKEMKEAIPPAYTRYIGTALRDQFRR